LQNRNAMANAILESNGLKQRNRFDSVHNYIDLETMIARKGAISAKKGEKLVVPFNSRDGSVIAEGKGNEDWNHSAPHGAGRKASQKKNTLSKVSGNDEKRLFNVCFKKNVR